MLICRQRANLNVIGSIAGHCVQICCEFVFLVTESCMSGRFDPQRKQRSGTEKCFIHILKQGNTSVGYNN